MTRSRLGRPKAFNSAPEPQQRARYILRRTHFKPHSVRDDAKNQHLPLPDLPTQRFLDHSVDRVSFGSDLSPLLAVMAEFAGCAAILRAVDMEHVSSNIFGPAKTRAALGTLKRSFRFRDVFVLHVFLDIFGTVKTRAAHGTFVSPFLSLPSSQLGGV